MALPCIAAMASQSTKLKISARDASNSRATRRLRRAGQVPGVLYGGGDEPLPFAVAERELRHALAATGAVVELELDGASSPAVLKEAQRHPVRGQTLHVDFLRVRLDVAIHTTVPLELVGGEDAPGTKEGGVLEHVTREVDIEALPTDIPERLELDVSGMQVNDTLFLAAVRPSPGVTILDDTEETVVATLTPPRLEAELEALEEGAIEEETGVVGEGEEAPEGEAEGEAAAGGDGERSAE
jgi:large subunit ribosomal protein L25